MKAGAVTPAVSVIIPARDAARTLPRTLDALAEQRLDEQFEVIVVDDGSADETPDVALRRKVRLIRNERSEGPGAARNHGVRAARGRVLAFTDADCYPAPWWLAKGLEAISGADLVQGRVDPDPSATRTPFDRSLGVWSDGGFYQTANLFVRREIFDAVGGFRDWVLERRGEGAWSHDRQRPRARRAPVGEDALFGWTARRLGARSAFAADAVVHHAVVPGHLLDDIADRWHWAREMPGLARLVPEIRVTTFHRRLFFNVVTARFDYALAGAVVCAISGRKIWLAAAIPYIRHLVGQSSQWNSWQRARYALGAPIVDAATLAALVTGSVAWRAPVL